MTSNRLKFALIAALLAAACHRGASTMQREQKSYEVVPEGQASGVTATINAPGEIPPPLTNTSVDTTSNFTLTPNVDTSGTVTQGTIAGTLPPAPPRVIITNTNPPRPKQPEMQPPPPPQTDTTATEEQEQEQEPQEEPAPPPPPTQTDTRGW